MNATIDTINKQRNKEPISIENNYAIPLVLLWLNQETCTNFSTNRIQDRNLNKCDYRHSHFPALGACCPSLLYILIGHLSNGQRYLLGPKRHRLCKYFDFGITSLNWKWLYKCFRVGKKEHS